MDIIPIFSYQLHVQVFFFFFLSVFFLIKQIVCHQIKEKAGTLKKKKLTC